MSPDIPRTLDVGKVLHDVDNQHGHNRRHVLPEPRPREGPYDRLWARHRKVRSERVIHGRRVEVVFPRRAETPGKGDADHERGESAGYVER